MAKLLETGQKVKYTHAGKEHNGVIHGVKTHETAEGQITRVSYLIDTGEIVHEDVGINAKTGKPKVVRQPEQLEVDQNFVRVA